MLITEQGIVEKTEGYSAWVRVVRSSACDSCGSRSKCKVDTGAEVVVTAENSAGGGVGDRVRLSMPSGSFFKSTFLVYIVPVAALVAGAYAGTLPFILPGLSPDAASVICGFGAMAISFLMLRMLDRRAAGKPANTPRITGIIHRSSPKPGN